MNANKREGEFIVGLIGMGGFFLAWLGLLLLVEATAVLLGASIEVANCVGIAVMLPMAATFLLTGDMDRFRQIGQWVSNASRRRE